MRGGPPIRDLRQALWIAAFAGILVTGCATMEARRYHADGEKAEQAGDYPAAVRAYEAAVDAQPGNPQYIEALAVAKNEARKAHVAAAEAAEKSGDSAKARAEWKKAASLEPGDRSLEARAELATLGKKWRDPVDHYQLVRKLAGEVENEATASKLAAAEKEAFLYYQRLAELAADGDDLAFAYDLFEKARAIDPEHAVFTEPGYLAAKSRHLEGVADERMEAGDRLGAFETYEQAAALHKGRGLMRKLRKAKRGAGPLIEQLEQARGFADLGQWEDAAELYTVIRERPDAPEGTAETAADVRRKSAELRADRALSYADRGAMDQGQAVLALALEHTDGHEEVVALVAEGIDRLKASDPTGARDKFDFASEMDGSLKIVKAGQALALASARASFERARKDAEIDPAAAMVRLSRLDGFKKELRGYGKTRKKLVRGAFKALIEQAELKADAGLDNEAAEMLATALDISTAPRAIKDPLKSGTEALLAGDYATAEEVFAGVLAEHEKSRIAKIGSRIAHTRRLDALRQQAADARAVDDPIRAASAYQAILTVDPEDEEAVQGLEELKGLLVEASMKAAEGHDKGGRKGAAYVYYQRAIDLEPDNAEARASLDALGRQFVLRELPLAWVAAVKRGDALKKDACPEAEEDFREKVILYLTKTRKLGAEFLLRGDTLEVDSGERPPPPVRVDGALDYCAANEAGASIAATVRVRVGGDLLYESRVQGKFDPSSVPKDELEEGLSPQFVLNAALSDGAKAISRLVLKKSKMLAKWREIEAKAYMRSNNDEAAARAYAKLRQAGDKLTAGERSVLRELERFIVNRFR